MCFHCKKVNAKNADYFGNFQRYIGWNMPCKHIWVHLYTNDNKNVGKYVLGGWSRYYGGN